jgi:hypothetical protein
VIEVVLEDHRGGDRIDLALLAYATHIAALGARNVFSFLGAEALVPHLDGYADHAFGHAGEVLGTPGLATLRTVGVQGQADDDVGHPFSPRHVDERVEDGGEAVGAVEDS